MKRILLSALLVVLLTFEAQCVNAAAGFIGNLCSAKETTNDANLGGSTDVGKCQSALTVPIGSDVFVFTTHSDTVSVSSVTDTALNTYTAFIGPVTNYSGSIGGTIWHSRTTASITTSMYFAIGYNSPVQAKTMAVSAYSGLDSGSPLRYSATGSSGSSTNTSASSSAVAHISGDMLVNFVGFKGSLNSVPTPGSTPSTFTESADTSTSGATINRGTETQYLLSSESSSTGGAGTLANANYWLDIFMVLAPQLPTPTPSLTPTVSATPSITPTRTPTSSTPSVTPTFAPAAFKGPICQYRFGPTPTVFDRTMSQFYNCTGYSAGDSIMLCLSLPGDDPHSVACYDNDSSGHNNIWKTEVDSSAWQDSVKLVCVSALNIAAGSNFDKVACYHQQTSDPSPPQSRTGLGLLFQGINTREPSDRFVLAKGNGQSLTIGDPNPTPTKAVPSRRWDQAILVLAVASATNASNTLTLEQPWDPTPVASSASAVSGTNHRLDMAVLGPLDRDDAPVHTLAVGEFDVGGYWIGAVIVLSGGPTPSPPPTPTPTRTP